MPWRQKDILILVSLLLAIAIELFLLLAHSGVISLRRSIAHVGGEPAGHITRLHNQLRRRSLNSLIWEEPFEAETIYFHDSILTLKESHAAVELNNGAEVDLMENTLITIEPVEEMGSGEITLRFMRGSVQARNSFQKSKINADQWSVSLGRDTDVELRAVDDGQFEVQVLKGSAAVDQGANSQLLTENSIMRLAPDGPKTWLKTTELAWENPKGSKRIYTHEGHHALTVSWSGEAKQVVLQTLGAEERKFPISPGQKTFLLDLPIGQHRLFVRADQKTSDALDIQVWRAPVIHLVSPLPRNRETLDKPVEFIWQKMAGMKSYRLKLIDAKGTRDIDAPENSLEVRFDQEEDVQWFVEGIDEDGNEIPTLYRNPLFLRQNPFAPPKLKAPKVRLPAAEKPQPGAWIWNLLMPSAQAEEKIYEAIFKWEPVDGANQYAIEISESEDFRQPLINTVTKQPEFVWKGFKLKQYYWRVAAGHTSGRMGIFSEPVQIDLRQVDGILVREAARVAAKKLGEGSVRKDKITIDPKDTNRDLIPPEDLNPLPPPLGPWQMRGWVDWRPLYSLASMKGAESAVSTLDGAGTKAFSGGLIFFGQNRASWEIGAQVASFHYKPKEDSDFQKDLRWTEWRLQVVRQNSAWGIGLSTERLLQIDRETYNSVVANPRQATGLILWYDWTLTDTQSLRALSQVGFFNDGQALLLGANWRHHFTPRFYFGADLEFNWTLTDYGMSRLWRLFAPIGMEF
ncbi:MAG: FecR domain-containing protein [Bdellovibrionales bacterium]